MGVSCQILVNKTKEGVYKPGQSVTGVVKYAIDKPTEYKNITISLVGTGKCSWSESDSSENGGSTEYTGTEKLFTIFYTILNDRTIQPGCYDHRFEFKLPNDLPSSFKNNICTIRYQIKLVFEKRALLSINRNFSTELTVYGYVTPAVEVPVIFGLEKTLFKLFSVTKQKISLKIEMDKCYFIPGENVHFKLVVSNDTDVKIPSINIELYSQTIYTSNGNTKNKRTQKEKDCEAKTAAVPERRIETLTCVVPTRPDLYSIQNSKVMSREYNFKVTVRLPMPHTNASVDVPVVIGERMEDQTADPDDVEEPPPSYWETMCEDKVKE